MCYKNINEKFILDAECFRLYNAYPERLKETVSANNNATVIIDEVQKCPQLLDIVHNLIEEKQNRQFILTGSSACKLKRAGVNLLGGRALLKHLHPFMAAELNDTFNLENALQFGLLPLIHGSTSPQETLQAYVGLYLREEVQQEGLVRNIGGFARFLEVISFSHAQILNLSNIAREGPLDIKSKIDGAALEGLVLQHLKAWNDYQNTIYNLYYWRTKAGLEVDFIVYGENNFWAIEVKNSATIHPQDLRGLREFCHDYPEAKPLFLYRGKERLQKNNILCVPVDDFLRQLHLNQQLV